MTGDGVGWWALIPAVIIAVLPFFLVKRARWWPGAYGWAIALVSIGLLVGDNFRSWGSLGISGIALGAILGFTGVMTGPNSPA